jgi:hypothetical protein
MPRSCCRPGVRGLDEKMVMVGHEKAGVTDPIIALVDELTNHDGIYQKIGGRARKVGVTNPLVALVEALRGVRKFWQPA